MADNVDQFFYSKVSQPIKSPTLPIFVGILDDEEEKKPLEVERNVSPHLFLFENVLSKEENPAIQWLDLNQKVQLCLEIINISFTLNSVSELMQNYSMSELLLLLDKEKMIRKIYDIGGKERQKII